MPHAGQRDGLTPLRYGPCGFAAVVKAWERQRAGYSLPCLLVASDFDRETATAFDSLAQAMPAGSPVIAVSLAPGKPWNTSIRKAETFDAVQGKGVRALVESRGRPLDSAKVSVTVSGLYAGGGTVAVGKDDTATVSVAAAGELRDGGGVLSLEVPDPLVFDNAAYFSVRRPSGIPVVVLGEAEITFPLAAAFASISDGRFAPVMQKKPSEVGFDLLDSATVIAIPRYSTPIPLLASIAGNPLPRDKVAIVALEPSEDGVAALHALLSRSGIPAASLRSMRVTTPALPVLSDTVSELWRGFPRRVTREAVIYRFVEGLPGTPLVRLDNGVPLVSQVQGKNGMVLVLVATPVGVTDANNLCETGFFVACIDRVTRHAMRSFTLPHEEWTAGIERRNPYYGSRFGAIVEHARGSFVDRWMSQKRVVIREPGVYKILPEGQAAYWIAVSPDYREGALEYVLPTPREHRRAATIVVDERRLLAGLQGRDRLFWVLPWIALLLFLLAEVLLWERSGIRK